MMFGISSSYSHCAALYEAVNVLGDAVSQLTVVVQNISKGTLSGYNLVDGSLESPCRVLVKCN